MPAIRSFGLCANFLKKMIAAAGMRAVIPARQAFLYFFAAKSQHKITNPYAARNIIPSFFVHALSAANKMESII